MTPRPGRNDPCHCGSGKKYKVCHLRIDEDSQRKPLPTPGAALRLRHARICEDVLKLARKRIGDAALSAIFRSWPGDREQARAESLVAWAAFHVAHEGHTLAERYREARAAMMDPRDRAVLDASRGAFFSVFAVAEATPSKTVLADLLREGVRYELPSAMPWGPSSRERAVLARPVAAEGTTIAQLGYETLPEDRAAALVLALRAALPDEETLRSFAGQRALVAAFENALAEVPPGERGATVVHEVVAIDPARAEELRSKVAELQAADPEVRAEVFDDAIELEAVGESSEAARSALSILRVRLGI